MILTRASPCLLVLSCLFWSVLRTSAGSCPYVDNGPVCALDGTTYDSACEAYDALALIAYPGDCRAECNSCPGAWSPVCIQLGSQPDTAQTYGSPCFATCNNRTNFTTADIGMPCKQKQGCMCTALYDPVCGADLKNYSNSGCAECWEVPVLFSGDCPGPTPYYDYTSLDPPVSSCEGSDSGPVCSVNGTTYDNACDAHAAAALIAYPGSCTSECAACPAAWNPVCIQDAVSGNLQTYGSPCFATCNNRTNFTTADIGIPCTQKEGGGCVCFDTYDPVCGADGKNYSNSACADCEEVPVLHTGTCAPPVEQHPQPSPSAQVNASSGCTCDGLQDPVCLVKPLDKATNQTVTTTYNNGCFAKCAGGANRSDTYYKAECNSTCDNKCSPWDVHGNKKNNTMYDQKVCCPGGEEYPNICYAKCLGGLSDSAARKCTKGQCKAARAVHMFENAGCPAGGVSARCLVDPCKNPKCKVKGATCVSNYCSKYFRLSFVDQLCAAYWIDKKGSLVEPTCKP